MAVMNLVQAMNDGLRQEMARDDSVMVMGEDVGRLGGVFRATEGLLDQFGEDRCVDTPLAEAGIVGTAIGLALAGWRPVCEMQYEAFSYPALDQVLSHLSRYRWRSGGSIEMPVVVRMPYGGGVRAPELHEDSPEAYYAHVPGVKVAMPADPADAKGLIAAAIRDPDPVVLLEPKALYRAAVGPVPDGEHFVELGRAVVTRHGMDATVIAYGAMLPVAAAAAEQLSERGEAEVEVLDLRTLVPLDEDAILDSVAKTGRAVIVHEAPRTAGFGAEVAALLAERGILHLRAPVRRVTGYDVPYPYWSLEGSYIPSRERVVAALEEVLRF
jgi:pyruvate/2-oxoglutarate/acetoin dehydrogenase E1 component